MFSFSDYDFMTCKMKIVVSSIESKLNEPFFAEYKLTAIDAIAKYIEVIKKFEDSSTKRDLYSLTDNEAEEFIRSHYCDLAKCIKNDEVMQVFDSLRYTFSCYAYNGLHQLYTRQENECWHPEIRITEVLTPNDINSLNQILTIYRGCDICEIEDRTFGQAWTTSLDVAKNFAYTHYKSQKWFDEKRRVVLETIYFRDDLLFSDQSIEYEVVVDVMKLGDVCISSR